MTARIWVRIRSKLGSVLTLKSTVKPTQATVLVERIHVFHVVHATHLLLDRRGDGLVHRQRVGARVSGLYLDLRVSDVRELGGGQAERWQRRRR